MQAMLRHWFKMFLPVAVLLAGLLGMLFSNLASSGKLSLPIQTVALEIQAAARDAGTQWMVMVCLASYFGTFLFLERRLLPQENAENAKAVFVISAFSSGPPRSGTLGRAKFQHLESRLWFGARGFGGFSGCGLEQDIGNE